MSHDNSDRIVSEENSHVESGEAMMIGMAFFSGTSEIDNS
jgi:hypothetical protein